MEAYLPLVRAAAERMRAKLAGQVELDDLLSSGAIGLMHAVQSFDPGRGVKFETYCLARIRGAMLDELRSMDWVPRLARSRYRKLGQAAQILEATTGRKPTDAELARKLHIPLGKLRQMQADAQITGQVSLEHPVDAADDWGARLGDTLPCQREEDPTRQTLRQELKELIETGLSRAERLVILLYYCEEMSMREIGETLDLSESRVSQMHSTLLVRLREKLEAQGAFPPTAA
jgi:RNA polymerase sigma factor for flagellar operon FliA